jgi:ketosteroid isomerase-like protein
MRTPREVSESYWVAECRRDIEAVMAHYLPDAVYQDGGGRLVGHDQIRTFYEGSIRDFPGLQVSILKEFPRTPDESALQVHAILTDHDGQRFVINGLIVITVRDGKLASVRCFEDPLMPESPGGDAAQ